MYYNNYNRDGIIWVQGEAGAKAYLVAPNQTVLLMDAEGSKFYIKSADQSGMPMMRAFTFQEATESPQSEEKITMEQFATKEDISAVMAEIKAIKERLHESTTYKKSKQSNTNDTSI